MFRSRGPQLSRARCTQGNVPGPATATSLALPPQRPWPQQRPWLLQRPWPCPQPYHRNVPGPCNACPDPTRNTLMGQSGKRSWSRTILVLDPSNNQEYFKGQSGERSWYLIQVTIRYIIRGIIKSTYRSIPHTHQDKRSCPHNDRFHIQSVDLIDRSTLV